MASRTYVTTGARCYSPLGPAVPLPVTHRATGRGSIPSAAVALLILAPYLRDLCDLQKLRGPILADARSAALARRRQRGSDLCHAGCPGEHADQLGQCALVVHRLDRSFVLAGDRVQSSPEQREHAAAQAVRVAFRETSS